MAEAAEGGKALGIGARLRAGRERAGLTVIQAAERLHLDPKVIEALEDERFEFLGAPVYVRGHMRRYAELVGEPAGELQETWSASLRAAAPPDLTHAPHADVAPDPRRLAGPLAVVAGALGIALAVWWVLSGSPQPAPARATEADRATVAAAPRVAEPVTAVAASAPRPTAASPAAAPTRAPPVPTPSPADVPAPQAAPPSRAGNPVELRLTLNADSWVEIYDARGERLFYDVAAANSVQTVSGRAPLRVVLGNAPGVAVAVNGHAVPIPPDARRDEGARFVVSSTGRVAQAR